MGWRAPEAAPAADDLGCSFCRRHRREVRRLVASGPAVICDTCIVTAVALVVGPPDGEALAGQVEAALRKRAGHGATVPEGCAAVTGTAGENFP